MLSSREEKLRHYKMGILAETLEFEYSMGRFASAQSTLDEIICLNFNRANDVVRQYQPMIDTAYGYIFTDQSHWDDTYCRKVGVMFRNLERYIKIERWVKANNVANKLLFGMELSVTGKSYLQGLVKSMALAKEDIENRVPLTMTVYTTRLLPIIFPRPNAKRVNFDTHPSKKIVYQIPQTENTMSHIESKMKGVQKWDRIVFSRGDVDICSIEWRKYISVDNRILLTAYVYKTFGRREIVYVGKGKFTMPPFEILNSFLGHLLMPPYMNANYK